MSGRDETDAALAALAGAIEGAENVVPLRAEREPAAPAEDGEGEPEKRGGDGSGGGRKRGKLPDDCPVTPLGKEGTTHYYLDALHQLLPLSARDHSRNNLASLFAPLEHKLEVWWPRKKLVKEKDEATGETVERYVVTGFKVEQCADDLMGACARRGVWRPQGRLRGIGAWRDQNGDLTFHCGDRLWTREGEKKTGWHDGHVYPSYAPIPSPFEERVPAGEDGPAHELLALLRTWNWERSDAAIDALLFLGWIGAALVGGALEWRPMVFVTGDKASGKSTLHRLVKQLFGEELIETADTTDAALSQELGPASVPIAIDELEADADNRRQRAVIRLARIASSGSTKRRGSANHQSSEFKAQSCFLFSAILMPPLDPQDRSRMAVLRLKPLPRLQAPPIIAPALFRQMGRQFKRRMADQWHRFDETLQLYHQALGRAGHDNRGANQFSALLACADLLLYDHSPDSDTLAEWQGHFNVEKWLEALDCTSNAEECIAYLAQTQPESWRGGSKQSVAEICAELNREPAISPTHNGRATLAAGGLGYVVAKTDGERYLAVPYAHRQLSKLFEGEVWGSHAGAAGGWIEALCRLEGVQKNRVTRIAGRSTKCIYVPMKYVTDGLDMAAQVELEEF